MGRDNISGSSGGFLKSFFLIPGKVIQWFLYIFVGKLSGYGMVRQNTRLARSPFMTWIFSFIGWFAAIYFILEETGNLELLSF